MGFLDTVGMMADTFVTCTIMDRVTDSASDGVFGTEEHYRPGAKILAMLEKQMSREMQIAEAQGLDEQYLIVVPSGVSLKKDDVIRRDSDGLTLRVTSNTRDAAAPPASTVQIAKCSAKAWVIPA